MIPVLYGDTYNTPLTGDILPVPSTTMSTLTTHDSSTVSARNPTNTHTVTFSRCGAVSSSTAAVSDSKAPTTSPTISVRRRAVSQPGRVVTSVPIRQCPARSTADSPTRADRGVDSA